MFKLDKGQCQCIPLQTQTSYLVSRVCGLMVGRPRLDSLQALRHRPSSSPLPSIGLQAHRHRPSSSLQSVSLQASSHRPSSSKQRQKKTSSLGRCEFESRHIHFFSFFGGDVVTKCKISVTASLCGKSSYSIASRHHRTFKHFEIGWCDISLSFQAFMPARRFFAN